MHNKTCSWCGTHLEAVIENFRENRKNRDGLDNYCRPCADSVTNGNTPEDNRRGIVNEKYCTNCHDLKPIHEYGWVHKADNRRRTECKSCTNTKRAQRDRRTSKETWKRKRKERLVREYGITCEQYDDLLDKQDGKCGICKTLLNEKSDSKAKGHNRLAVDHCHESGVVRGLLCHKCNLGLGAFDDNPVQLSNAISYLLSFHENGGPVENLR